MNEPFRDKVIRNQLLFRPGEPYLHRIVQETERILRANDYLNDAVIRPVAWDGRKVDLEVRTRDTWTLNPGINFSRQGGENSGSIQLEEKNLLGNGQKLSFGWSNDVDREAINFEFFDPHFHSTWTRLGIVYSDADDGDTKALRVDRPFYSLDTRRAGGVYLYDSIRNDPRYAYGEEVGEFQNDEQFVEAYGGRSAGWREGWVRRWTAGATYHRRRYAATPDRCQRTSRSPIPGSASTWSRTCMRYARTWTRSSARKTCCSGCGRADELVTRRSRWDPTATR